eukprot:TRINITY_DN5269_c0_g1_i1.p1 TRINITY_DN5269_c0_g1~~TRINITY_DN5269_c0_g1_i1.p1  ORF type:complete len:1279 (-),score=230.02 TRINITY_DN5269_c0_g1_i1:22-3858(-)
MSGTQRFAVLYAKQIKQKKYVDGKLTFTLVNRKAVLFSATGSEVASDFLSRDTVVEPGADFDVEGFTVSVEERDGVAEVSAPAVKVVAPTYRKPSLRRRAVATDAEEQVAPMNAPARQPNTFHAPPAAPYRKPGLRKLLAASAEGTTTNDEDVPPCPPPPQAPHNLPFHPQPQRSVQEELLHGSTLPASQTQVSPIKQVLPACSARSVADILSILSKDKQASSRLPHSRIATTPLPHQQDDGKDTPVIGPTTPPPATSDSAVALLPSKRRSAQLPCFPEGEVQPEKRRNVLHPPSSGGCSRLLRGMAARSGSTPPPSMPPAFPLPSSHAAPFVAASPTPATHPKLRGGMMKTVSGGGVHFPSMAECQAGAKRAEATLIPNSFGTVSQYVQVFTQALNCEILSLVSQFASRFFAACQSFTNQAAACGHGKEMRLTTSKGPNKGRQYYKCPKGCFLRWADQLASHGVTSNPLPAVTVTVEPSIDVQLTLRKQGIGIYFGCEMFSKDKCFGSKKGVSAKQFTNANSSKLRYLMLHNQEHSSKFAKDDLWIISTSPSFIRDQDHFVCIAKSTFHGPTKNGLLEVFPLSGSLPPGKLEVHLLHGPNATIELAMLDTLEHLLSTPPPIMPALLDPSIATTTQLSSIPPLTCDHVASVAEEFISAYNLNEDQTTVVRQCAAWFGGDSNPAAARGPCLLVHGVFGSGKSFLLSVVVKFLCRVLDEARDTKNRILIAASTNVAVDRVMQVLIDSGFTELMRVGNLKKIAKSVFPFSVHSSDMADEDQDALATLRDMLKDEKMSAMDRKSVIDEMEEIKKGQSEKRRERLKTVRVVGATCAACPFKVLDKQTFTIVIIDEASQLIEPLSLLPITRFGCEKLITVGDPLQLPPVLMSTFSHDTSEGLAKTLFSRLCTNQVPVMLRTQYRCHPGLSRLSNALFYDGKLLDGVSASDRAAVVPGLPPLTVVDADRGKEEADATGSYSNEHEINIVVQLVLQLLLCGVPGASVGVIALYKAQAEKITARFLQIAAGSVEGDEGEALQQLQVIQTSTVDAFQGAEKEIIILTCTRTERLGFSDSPKRLNVALTRAKRHLVVVGNLLNLRNNELWNHIISLADLVFNGDELLVSAGLECLLQFKQDQAVSRPKSSQSLPRVAVQARQTTERTDMPPRANALPVSSILSLSHDEGGPAAAVLPPLPPSTAQSYADDDALAALVFDEMDAVHNGAGLKPQVVARDTAVFPGGDELPPQDGLQHKAQEQQQQQEPQKQKQMDEDDPDSFFVPSNFSL